MSNIPQCQDLATKAELQQLRNQINQLLGRREGGSGTIDVLSAGSLASTEINARLVNDFKMELNPNTGSFETIFFVGLPNGSPGGGVGEALKQNATNAGKLLYDVGKTGFKIGQLGWRLSRSSDERARFNEKFWKVVTNYIDSNEALRKTEIGLRTHLNRSDNFWKAIDRAEGDFDRARQNITDYKQDINDGQNEYGVIATQCFDVESQSRSIDRKCCL